MGRKYGTRLHFVQRKSEIVVLRYFFVHHSIGVCFGVYAFWLGVSVCFVLCFSYLVSSRLSVAQPTLFRAEKRPPTLATDPYSGQCLTDIAP